MKMRIEVFLTVLAVGVTILPDDGFAFDGMPRPLPAPCGAERTASCAVALVEPYRLPDGLVIPLPLPRPAGLGMPNHLPTDHVCGRSDDCAPHPN